MHGTNDIIKNYSNEEIYNNILNTINYIKKYKKKAKILFLSCIHVNGRMDRSNIRIDELNTFLYNKLSKSIIWIDTRFLDDEFGKLDRKYTSDGLHLNEFGYTLLKNKLEEFLK